MKIEKSDTYTELVNDRVQFCFYVFVFPLLDEESDDGCWTEWADSYDDLFNYNECANLQKNLFCIK